MCEMWMRCEIEYNSWHLFSFGKFKLYEMASKYEQNIINGGKIVENKLADWHNRTFAYAAMTQSNNIVMFVRVMRILFMNVAPNRPDTH